MTRRIFCGLGAWATATTLSGARGDQGKEGERVVLDGVDRYRVMEPLFEGVRVVLSHRGETYTPAYIQGISGAAFRLGGPCPCAPTCCHQMGTSDLIRLLGYEPVEAILGWKDDDVSEPMQALIPRIKAELRAGRPMLVWHAFTTTEWDVVAGFDDAKGVSLGRGSYAGLDGYAEAAQTRPAEATKICPALGATFVGAKTGALDAAAAEQAALREAVRHAHDREEVHQPGRPDLVGLRAYDRWADKFRDPEAKRGPGDSYCYYVYRSTHRAAAGFLREIAPRHAAHETALTAAGDSFAAEADVLDRAEPFLNWQTPEADPERNAKLWPLLAEARDHYAEGIRRIEATL